MGKIPTITIHDPLKEGDYRIINETDYDPEVHTLWEPSEVSDPDCDKEGPEPTGEDLADSTQPEIDLTDEELRAAIKEGTGKAPHPNTGRKKLIEAYLDMQK